MTERRHRCLECGHLIGGGRPRLYDVSDLTVGGQTVFTYRDQDQHGSIRASISQYGKRYGRKHKLRTVAPGIVEVTRTA